MKTGIYIHIPFCVKKCNYCAFLSAPSDEETRETYVRALIREIELRGEKSNRKRCQADTCSSACSDTISNNCSGDCAGSSSAVNANNPQVCDSIYFGGGTPSVLSENQIRRILTAVRDNFDVSEDAEITLEANPGTLGQPTSRYGEVVKDINSLSEMTETDDASALTTLKAYREMGINRLSMGVQSMNDERLKFLGRIHDSETVIRDFRLAREAGFDNINLDIIFSVPGETIGDALDDIRRIAELGPEHISFYSLQIEEGTPIFEQWQAREIEEVSDEIDRETYHRGCELLKKYGYEHYEISNFAKRIVDNNTQHDGCTSRKSRHNSKYWDMSEYVGLGLGASGFEQGVRYKNLSQLEEYESAISNGELPIEEEHLNTAEDNISEAVFLGLRRVEGVRYEDVPIYVDAEGVRYEDVPINVDAEGVRYEDVPINVDAEVIRQSNVPVEAPEDISEKNASERFWNYYKDEFKEAESFVDSGHLIIDDEGLRLTEKGIDISNQIMSLFVNIDDI